MVLTLLSGLGPVRAQMPSRADFDAAVAAAAPQARQEGVALRTDGLWRALLAARVPMMAAAAGRQCHIGYSELTPGRDFRWLFPSLPDEERRRWLQGLVQHELAHCLDAATGTAADGAGAERWHETLADLAFALHVDGAQREGGALIERLAGLRAANAATDPGHDTAAALRCYLAHPARGGADDASLGWTQRLLAWRARCFSPG